MSRTSTSRSLLATVLSAVLFLAACGASGSDDAASSTTTDGGDATTTTGGDDDPTPTPTTEDTPDTTEGGGEPGDRQAYLDAFVMDFDDEDEPIFEQGQVDCLAEKYLDVIGLDNLVEAGVTPEEYGEGDDFPEELGLDEDTANELYDQFGECDIDIKEIFVDLFSGFSPEPLTDEQKACIDDTLTEDRLRESFVADLLDLEDDGSDPFDELEACVPDSFGEGTTEDAPTGDDGPAADSGDVEIPDN